eukprot:c8683_g1_i4.p1 GENE.c8683_g1_i4~~c8683_g1_i4.p1  ORF type:complete len:804 (+),score=140.04 c8683_g1_i4:30-2414(+)
MRTFLFAVVVSALVPYAAARAVPTLDSLDTLISSLEKDLSLEEAKGLSELTGDQLFSKDPEVRFALFTSYRTFLRARRYLTIVPKNMARFSDKFEFNSGDITVRALKLGVKLTMLGVSAAMDESAHVAQKVHHNAVHVAQGVNASVTADKALAGWGVRVGVAGFSEWRRYTIDARHALWYQRGAFVPTGGFVDATFSNHMETYLTFSAHRNALGKWDMKKVEETRVSCLQKGTFVVASAVEAFVNHSITIGVGLLFTIVAVILILIPEPTTTAIGIGMLAGDAIYGFSAWAADSSSHYVVKSGVLSHLTSILISFFSWEVSKGCLDKSKDVPLQLCPAVDCSIVDSVCDVNQVCLREFLYSGDGHEGSLAHEFSPLGWCSPDPKSTFGDASALRELNEHCELHRDCASGYCHFFSPYWESENMWKEFLNRHNSDPDSEVSDIPETIRMILLDGGICARPVALDFEGPCLNGADGTPTTLVTISASHEFKACIPRALVSENHKDDIPDVVSAAYRVEVFRYAEPITFYAHSVENPSHYLYWYTYGGTSNFFPTLRLSPDSLLQLQGDDVRNPIQTSLVPWTIAQLGAFIPLKCVDSSCSKFVQDTTRAESEVSFGDYVAMVWECPTLVARRAGMARSKESTTLSGEAKIVLGPEPPAYAKGDFCFLEAMDRDVFTQTLMFRWHAYPLFTKPALTDRKLVLKKSFVFRVLEAANDIPTTRVPIRKHQPFVLASTLNGKEVCNNNPVTPGQQDYEQTIASSCVPLQRPHVGRAYRSPSAERLSNIAADPQTYLRSLL